MAFPPVAADMASLDANGIRAITPLEIASATFTAAHMAAFPLDHVGVLSIDQIRHLRSADLNALDNSFIGRLSRDQVSAFNTAQISSLVTSGKIASLNSDQIAGLDPVQLAPLTGANVKDLINKIQPDRVEALISALEPAQRTPLIAKLTPAQIGAISNDRFAELVIALSSSFILHNLATIAPKILTLTPQHISKLSVAQAKELVGVLVHAQMPGLTADHIKGLTTTAEIAALIQPLNLANLKSEQIPWLTPAQIGALATPAHINALDATNHIPKLTAIQIAHFAPARMPDFTPAQIKAFDANLQVPAFSNLQILALTPAQIPHFTPAQINSMAIQHLNPTHIPLLTVPEQIEAIDTKKLMLTQIPNLTLPQVQALKPGQVQALTPVQLGALGPINVAALSPEQLSGLTEAQRTVLIPNLTPAQINSMGKAPTAEQVANAEKTRAQAGVLDAQANEARHQTSRKDNQAAADIKQQDALTGMTNANYIDSLLERNNPMAMAAFQGIVNRPQPPSPELVQNITSTVANAMKDADPAAIGEAITAALLAVNRPYIEALSHQDNQMNAMLEDRAAERTHREKMSQEARLDAQEARTDRSAAHRETILTAQNGNLSTALGTMTAANMKRFHVRAAERIVHDLIQH